MKKIFLHFTLLLPLVINISCQHPENNTSKKSKEIKNKPDTVKLDTFNGFYIDHSEVSSDEYTVFEPSKSGSQ